MINSAQDIEKLSLARKLHDGIAQDLVGLGYEIDLLLAAAHEEGSNRAQIRALRFSVDELITKVRREMYELRDPINLSLQDELSQFARSICENLSLTLEISNFEIPAEVGIVLKAVAIELLRNVIAHSRASEIEFKLTNLENHTYLEVSDNGVGGANLESDRFGLIGVQESITSLGGFFRLSSGDTGTRVAITL